MEESKEDIQILLRSYVGELSFCRYTLSTRVRSTETNDYYSFRVELLSSSEGLLDRTYFGVEVEDEDLNKVREQARKIHKESYQKLKEFAENREVNSHLEEIL